MSILLTADLHLTDRPKDEYRFDIFPWIAAQVRKYDIDQVCILGDLTEFKDHHSARLVNRIVDELSRVPCDVHILKGNHDYIDPQTPFFMFLVELEHVTYRVHPMEEVLGGLHILFLPHTPDPTEAQWEERVSKFKPDLILTHACFAGATSRGTTLGGLDAEGLFGRSKASVWSGDIHEPQKVGPVEYVGAPYHVTFGEDFEPRVVLLEGRKHAKDLHFPAPRKITLNIESPSDLLKVKALREGDQVKVRLALSRSEFVDWPRYKKDIREACEKLGVLLTGAEIEEHGDGKGSRADLVQKMSRRTPKEVVEAFCDREKLHGLVREVGIGLAEQDT